MKAIPLACRLLVAVAFKFSIIALFAVGLAAVCVP